MRSAIGATAHHALGVLNRDATLRLLNEDHEAHNDDSHSQDDEEDFKALGLSDGPQGRGEGCGNGDENEQRHSITHTTLSDHFAHEHNQPGSRGHSDDHQHDGVPGVVREQLVTGRDSGATKECTASGNRNQGCRLKQGQTNGHVAGVLGELALTSLAFFMQGFKVRDDHAQELRDNRRCDVGHDAQGKNGELQKSATTKEVD